MRIPMRKIYRAFPELDAYTDAQCELLMQRVNLSMVSRQAIRGMTFAAVVVTLIVMLPIMYVFVDTLIQGNPGWGMVRYDGERSLVWTVGMVGPAVLAGFLTRDTVLRKQLVSAITLHIEKVRCPECKYILIGQRDHNGAVTCPECGHTTLLRLLGLEPADLIPPESAADPFGRKMGESVDGETVSKNAGDIGEPIEIPDR